MTNNHTPLMALDSMPFALDPNQPFPDDYGDFVPVGQCPTHGLEPHQADSREVHTGAGDICLASLFMCGEVDAESVF